MKQLRDLRAVPDKRAHTDSHLGQLRLGISGIETERIHGRYTIRESAVVRIRGDIRGNRAVLAVYEEARAGQDLSVQTADGEYGAEAVVRNGGDDHADLVKMCVQ